MSFGVAGDLATSSWHSRAQRVRPSSDSSVPDGSSHSLGRRQTVCARANSVGRVIGSSTPSLAPQRTPCTTRPCRWPIDSTVIRTRPCNDSECFRPTKRGCRGGPRRSGGLRQVFGQIDRARAAVVRKRARLHLTFVAWVMKHEAARAGRDARAQVRAADPRARDCGCGVHTASPTRDADLAQVPRELMRFARSRWRLNERDPWLCSAAVCA